MRKNSTSSTSRNFALKYKHAPFLTSGEACAFRRTVYAYYRRCNRRLPWRGRKDPYGILVSEFMLQQTQAKRVAGYYPAFLRAFPSFRALAQAELREVLRAWQGLGYNRRALLLQRLAREVIERHGGRLPVSAEELIKLPGIGKATAGALLAFAFNKPAVFIETNIRSVFLHHFFPRQNNVSDADLLPLVSSTLDTKNPRRWYWALMDYGVFLKKKYANPSRRSAHHARQVPFEGSDRQLRGKLTRMLLGRATIGSDECRKDLCCTLERFRRIKEKLCRQGLLREERGRLCLP